MILVAYGVQIFGQSDQLALPNSGVIQYTGTSPVVGSYLNLPYTITSVNPLDELSLSTAYLSNVLSLDLEYKGQYPKMCKQTMYDVNHDVLFFIVDNNIYNKNGDAFLKAPNTPHLLHNFAIDDGNYIHRFQDYFIIAPEVVIVPVPVFPALPNGCDQKFYIFYIVEKDGEGELNNDLWETPYPIHAKSNNLDAKLFVRTLTYHTEDYIELSSPKELFHAESYYNSTSIGPMALSCGISEYNPSLGEYLFFFQCENNLIAYKVGNSINDISLQNAKAYVDTYGQGSMTEFPELEICKPTGQNNYLIAYTQCTKEINILSISPSFASLPGSNYGASSIINPISVFSNNYSKYTDNSTVPSGTWDNGFIGLEFSPDGDFLYLTQEGYAGIKCFDIQDNFWYRMETSLYDFSMSFIELGKDSKLYFANFQNQQYSGTNYVYGIGNICTISNPETPGIVTQYYPILNNSNLTSTSTTARGSAGFYDANARFHFPDQVDGYNFNEHCDDLGIIHCVDFPSNLSSVESWSPGVGNNPWDDVDGHIYFCDDITVPTGVEITVSDMVFHFKDEAVMNMPAGNVSVNGALIRSYRSTFTNFNACDNDYLWGGIRLNGNSFKQGHPVNSQEPVIIFLDNSIVENARIGVFAYHGGIVIAEDSYFLNNRISVSHYEFQNFIGTAMVDDLSKYTDCTFEVNPNYLGVTMDAFLYQARLFKVDGIPFDHCIFENSTLNKVYNSKGNIGISSLGSGFTVDGNCGSGAINNCSVADLSQFKGFNFGINAASSNKAIKVEESYFINNIYSLQISAVPNPMVIRNKFELGYCDISYGPPNVVGINLVSSTGYRVEDNYTSENSATNYHSVGVHALNSGEENNQIYNNDFSNITKGINANGNNKSGSIPNTGLEILCNDFITLDSRDIDITEDPYWLYPSIPQGIKDYQGCYDPIAAGNRFSQNLPVIEAHIYNHTSPLITYCYYYNNLDYSYFPDFLNGKIIGPVAIVGYDLGENYCPSKIEQGHTHPLPLPKHDSIATAYASLRISFYNILYNYLQGIDDGDTPLLLQQIQESWPQDAWDLRSDLISISPYVSREALIDAAYSDVLPAAMLLEVCLANPDATKDEDFLDVLRNLSNPMPEYMIEIIRDSWDDETIRSSVEKQLGNIGRELDYCYNLLILDEKTKEERGFDTLRLYYEGSDYLLDKYILADTYMDEGDYTLSAIVLDDIATSFELSDFEIDEYYNYLALNEILHELSDSGLTIFELDTINIQILEQIANDNTGWSSVKARNILCFAFDLCVDYPANQTDTLQEKSAIVIYPTNVNFEREYSKVIVSPIPADEYVDFLWDIPIINNQAIVSIFNASGILVHSFSINDTKGQYLWDCRIVEDGLYLYQVSSDDGIIAKGKIVIQH